MRFYPGIAILTLAWFLGTGLFPGGAAATPIDLSASVDPWHDGDGFAEWDPLTLTGTALYELRVLPTSDHGANAFWITFEGDIFDLSGTAHSIAAPAGWSSGSFLNGQGNMEYVFTSSSVDVLNPGEAPPLRLAVDYTLLSAERFSQASGADWAWDAGVPGGRRWGLRVPRIISWISARPPAGRSR